ncbi:class I adenylate-forming enzyme family protein, partial [candidate division CSSED10-310 bacterium]
WKLVDDDVILMVAPASHIFGQSMITAACVANASISFLPRFEPEAFLKTIERDGVTFFAGVPTLAHFMLNSPIVGNYNLSSLRKIMLSGAPLHPEIAQKLKQRFKVEIVTGYGMTEGVPVCFLTGEAYDRAPEGSVGLPAFGTSLRIVDENDEDVPLGEAGEILLRGPQMFKEYHNRSQETTTAWRNDWFHTGDIGKQDQNGHYYIVERLKDIIKRSGYAVSPSEVERVLLNHDAVAEAAVIGIPHEALSEEIKAFIVRKQGSSITDKELIAFCKTYLAAFKYPRIIEFRDSLPKNPTGKILRRLLREDS